MLRWTVVVPLKALPAAKSRLARDIGRPAHAELVRALRADTVAAARATDGVARILVVGDRPLDSGAIPDATRVLVQRSHGLNGALRDAAAVAAAEWPADGLAALVGDLPALHPGELSAALQRAAVHARAFAADAAGTGTTLLTARPGEPFRPAFGPSSAVRHARLAVPIDAGPGLRCDVDTARDLAQAVALGIGPETSAALQHVELPRGWAGRVHVHRA
jgi:2-phospho-L-lactate guanylyltransferase